MILTELPLFQKAKDVMITKYFIVETARVFAMDCIPLARAISNVMKNAMSQFLP